MSSLTYYWAAGGHAAQPKYNQFSYKGCQVGCGAVAWGILFAWADRQAGSGNSYWAGRWGIYRQNGGSGANALAPLNMDDGVKNMIREIRDHIGTFCISGQGATWPWSMSSARKYLSGRTGATLSTHYNAAGISTDDLRDIVIRSIRYRKTPAIIGTGWLYHYPVAYGYYWTSRVVRRCFIACWYETIYDRFFYVNQGWGGSGNGWISASTWFAGEIFP